LFTRNDPYLYCSFINDVISSEQRKDNKYSKISKEREKKRKLLGNQQRGQDVIEEFIIARDVLDDGSRTEKKI